MYRSCKSISENYSLLSLLSDIHQFYTNEELHEDGIEFIDSILKKEIKLLSKKSQQLKKSICSNGQQNGNKQAQLKVLQKDLTGLYTLREYLHCNIWYLLQRMTFEELKTWATDFKKRWGNVFSDPKEHKQRVFVQWIGTRYLGFSLKECDELEFEPTYQHVKSMIDDLQQSVNRVCLTRN